MNLIIPILLALQQLSAPPPLDLTARRVEREAWLMGTRLRIVIEGSDRVTGQHLGETALREVERVEALLSTWDASTPLSRINRMPPGVWAEVGPELRGLLSEVGDWSSRTRGAFDPRVGALIDAWDLRGPGAHPELSQIAAALASTGAAGLEFTEGRVRRASPSAWMDAGAFGKGAGLRAAAEAITATGQLREHRVLMDLGGQVLALAPPDAPWTIEVAHPQRRSEPVATLSVHDQSVSTSGTSERGRHVLDPRTGHPVEAWGSVTVVDPDALTADIVSTALYVMGPADGLAWATRNGLAALFLRSVDGRLLATWTPALEPWLQNAPID